MAQGKPRGSAKDHINCPNCNTEIKVGIETFVVCECGRQIQLRSLKSTQEASVNGQVVGIEMRSMDFK